MSSLLPNWWTIKDVHINIRLLLIWMKSEIGLRIVEWHRASAMSACFEDGAEVGGAGWFDIENRVRRMAEPPNVALPIC